MSNLTFEKKHPRGLPTTTPAKRPGSHGPTAGSFAVKEHSTPEASLGTAVDTDEDIKSVLAQIEMHARKYARRYRFSDETREEIQQDTIVDLLAQQKRKGTASIADPRLINVATRAVAQRYIDPDAHHYDLTARAILKKLAALQEDNLHRPLRSAEYKALADDVRLNAFEPGRRPHEDFYLENKQWSLDFPLSHDSNGTFGDKFQAPEIEREFATDDTQLADLVDGLENHGITTADGTVLEVKRTDVKRNVWNHLALACDAPTVVEGTLPSAARRRIAAAVKDHKGGISGLCRDWQLGDTTAQQDANLFAPFGALGDLDNRTRERIVEQLLHKPAFTDGLWESALAIAATPATPAAG